jgi:hypothetical protein
VKCVEEKDQMTVGVFESAMMMKKTSMQEENSQCYIRERKRSLTDHHAHRMRQAMAGTQHRDGLPTHRRAAQGNFH